MISVSQGRILTSEVGHSYAEGLEGSESGLDPRLRVTVVFTTAEGTIAALRTAGGLAKNLGARIALVVTEVVPFHFPLDHPPVSIEFLERRPINLVYESGIQAEEVSIEICLCRDQKQCLRQMLSPRSLVVIGGRRRWWCRRERKLEQLLRLLGHHVIFVDVKVRSHARSHLHSYCHPILRGRLGLY